MLHVKGPNSNEPISKILSEIADYLELEEENKHKVMTYRRASFIVRSLPYDITLMEQLTGIKGIGESLAATITEILGSGTCSLVERLRRKYIEKEKNGE